MKRLTNNLFTNMRHFHTISGLGFRRFLVEMETTAQEKDNLREIIRRVLANDKAWLDGKDIIAQEKGDVWVLNYNQFGGVNEFNSLTRGLIVGKPQGAIQDPLQLIKSFPFQRFFNRHEPHAAQIDFANSEALEKLDGSLVGVFFPTGDVKSPRWHTRRMVSSHEPDMQMTMTGFHGKSYNLMQLIGEYVKKIQFRSQDSDWCFVFEFIHEATQVWTKYGSERYGLHLTGARHLPTHKELSEDELDQYAKELKVPRPQRWQAQDDAAITALMKQMAAEISGFEGFVFRDKKTGKRVKLKDEDYVKFHHLLDQLSFKNLIPKVLDGEDAEIVSYFPSAKEKVDTIKQKYDELRSRTIEGVLRWKAKKLDRKTLALTMNDQEKDRWIRGAVFRYVDSPEEEIPALIDKELRDIAQKQIRKFIELLGLKDDSEDVGPNLEP